MLELHTALHLTFFAFASDDGDIRDRSISRLKTVLHSQEWETHLKFRVIDSIIDLVVGKLGFKEEHDGVEMNFGVSTEIRKEALEFLISDFDSFNPDIQYFAVSSFYRFLKTAPTLENCPENICDSEIRKNKEEWNLGKEVKNIIPSNADPSAVAAGAYGADTKRVTLEERKDWNEEMDTLKEILWEWIEDRLEDLETEFLVQGRLIRLAGEIENFSLQENIELDFLEQTKKWSENEDISIELRKLLASTRDKIKLYGFPATISPKLSEEKYATIIESRLSFIEKHLDAIFHEKLERQKSGFSTGKPKILELAFSIFEESDEGLLKREIFMENITTILKKGLLVNTKDLVTSTEKLPEERFAKIVEEAIERTRSEIELLPLMDMVGEFYASLKSQKQDPRPLFETLMKQMEIADNLFQRRIFLKTLLKGAEIFPTEANLSLNIVSANEYDVITQNHINTVMEKVDETF